MCTWRNVVDAKLHINGGIGTRHDIEGFDVDYVADRDGRRLAAVRLGNVRLIDNVE